METTIREYLPNDKESCLIAFKSNVPQYFTEQEIKDFGNFLDSLLTREFENIRTYYFVIITNDKVIGCGGFGEKDNSNVITLAWGLIHKDYHKKGYGKKLLQYRLEQIQKLYPHLPLVIDTTQFSYPFFEKHGFTTTKITLDFYEVGMHRYNMILK